MKNTPNKATKKLKTTKGTYLTELKQAPLPAGSLKLREDTFDLVNVKDPAATKHVITTGQVFAGLEDKWQQFDRTFLKEDVQQAFQSTLLKHKVVTYQRKQENDKYFKRSIRMLSDFEKNNDESNFPVPDYFIAQTKLISYREEVVVTRSDTYFPLFFALSLALLDPMEWRSFLGFHFKNTFEANHDAYKSFVHDLLLAYRSILNDKFKMMAEDYFSKMPLENSQRAIDSKSDADLKNIEFTINQKILFFHYLFNELGITRNSTYITDVARVVQGLTGIQLSAKAIKNTDIYKRLSNPLKDVDKSGMQNDLIIVRNQFERLGLNDIAKTISSEIHLKE